MKCSSLKEVKICEGLKQIESGTFNSCEKLEKIELPLSLEIISIAAFFESNNLKTVIYNGTQQDRNKIIIWELNDPLINADWIYK